MTSFTKKRKNKKIQLSVAITETRRGWPAIQIQVINDLVAAANCMGNPALATRHMTFLLQTMYNYLSPTERKDIALQLQGVAQQCEGAPVPLVRKIYQIFSSSFFSH